MNKANRLIKTRSNIRFFALIPLLLLFSGCGLQLLDLSNLAKYRDKPEDPVIHDNDTPFEIIPMTADGITLTWDCDISSAQVSFFELAYKPAHDPSADWVILTTIAASDAMEFDLNSGTLPTGDWIIGVLAVNATNATSGWHTSIDAHATPSNGWVINQT